MPYILLLLLACTTLPSVLKVIRLQSLSKHEKWVLESTQRGDFKDLMSDPPLVRQVRMRLIGLTPFGEKALAMLLAAPKWAGLEWKAQQVVVAHRTELHAPPWTRSLAGVLSELAFAALVFVACRNHGWMQTVTLGLAGLGVVGTLLTTTLSLRVRGSESGLLRLRSILAASIHQREPQPFVVPGLLNRAELDRWKEGLDAIERDAGGDPDRARALHDQRADAQGRVAP